MKLAAARLRLKLPFLLLSFFGLTLCICGFVRVDKAPLLAFGAERVGRYGGRGVASSNSDGLRWSAAGGPIESFLLSTTERGPRSRLTGCPAYLVGSGTAESWAPDASFKRCSSTWLRDVPGAYVPLTGRCRGGGLLAAPTAAARARKAGATNANAEDAFPAPAPSFVDTALPPQSDKPPAIDSSFCRADFACGAPDISAQGGGAAAPLWQPHGSEGLLKTVPSEGPVSFFDSRTDLHPSLTGASDDAFFVDFYGPLHHGAAEIAQTCLAAAKRFLRARELKGRRSQAAQQVVEQPALKESEKHKRNPQSHRAGLHPKAMPQSAGLPIVGSTDLPALLAQERFATPPYWLAERVAYALRRLRPSSFGFLVAQMLEALCRISEAEAKLGTTIDEFVSSRMQTYLRDTERMTPTEYAVHLTNGSPRAFNDVFKFRRGFPVFPWGLSTDSRATRSFMAQQLQVTEDALTQVTSQCGALYGQPQRTSPRPLAPPRNRELPSGQVAPLN